MKAFLLAAAMGFSLREPSVHKLDDDLLITTSLIHNYPSAVSDVRLTDISITRVGAKFAPSRIDPPANPNIILGDIHPGNRKAVNTKWVAGEFSPGETYTFTVSGIYDGGLRFQVSHDFVFPKAQRALLDIFFSFKGIAHAAEQKLKLLNATVEARFDKASNTHFYSVVNNSKIESVAGFGLEVVTPVEVTSPAGWTAVVNETSVNWMIDQGSKKAMIAPRTRLDGFTIRPLNGTQRYVTTPYVLVSLDAQQLITTGYVNTPDKE